MNAFLDTSALFALLDQDDANHQRAARAWKQLIENGARLITSNYILVETAALLQSRLGMDAVRVFQTKMLPPVHIEYVSADFRRLGMAPLLPAGKRKLSLVDCAGFEIMRQMGLNHVFTFGAHFRSQGFDTLP